MEYGLARLFWHGATMQTENQGVAPPTLITSAGGRKQRLLLYAHSLRGSASDDEDVSAFFIVPVARLFAQPGHGTGGSSQLAQDTVVEVSLWSGTIDGASIDGVGRQSYPRIC